MLETKKIDLDVLDLKIINVLLRHSNFSLREISKYVNVSPVTVQHRLNKILNKGIIKSFTVNLNLEGLGLFEVILLIKTNDSERALIFLDGINKIIELNETLDEYNIIAKAVVKDKEELIELQRAISSQRFILSLKSSLVLKKHKEDLRI